MGTAAQTEKADTVKVDDRIVIVGSGDMSDLEGLDLGDLAHLKNLDSLKELGKLNLEGLDLEGLNLDGLKDLDGLQQRLGDLSKSLESLKELEGLDLEQLKNLEGLKDLDGLQQRLKDMSKSLESLEGLEKLKDLEVVYDLDAFKKKLERLEELEGLEPDSWMSGAQIIIDGKEVKVMPSSLKPDDVSVIMLSAPGSKGARDFGEKGKDGIIEIKTRDRNVQVSGKGPVLIVDGKEVPYKKFASIPPDDIQSVTVLKNEGAKAYTDDPDRGVILVKTKK